jgi:hypothetical protein
MLLCKSASPDCLTLLARVDEGNKRIAVVREGGWLDSNLACFSTMPTLPLNQLAELRASGKPTQQDTCAARLTCNQTVANTLHDMLQQASTPYYIHNLSLPHARLP